MSAPIIQSSVVPSEPTRSDAFLKTVDEIEAVPNVPATPAAADITGHFLFPLTVPFFINPNMCNNVVSIGYVLASTKLKEA